MTNKLIIALAAIAAVVATGLIAGFNMFPFIVGYWLVLTMKNLLDIAPAEPKVLSLREAAIYLGKPVWVEEKGVDIYCEVLFDVDGKAFAMTQGQIEFGGILTGHALFSIDTYGETYRLWNARPTDRQRKAAKWQ